MAWKVSAEFSFFLISEIDLHENRRIDCDCGKLMLKLKHDWL